ncbi:MAG: hypothetical protein K2K75_11650 [Muribaculaceae bacterium]|nr:hypothetical protein [Muribaculaceae bacterium]
MRYDEDDRYLSNEEDDDLWDDELEISSDPISPAYDYVPDQSFTPGGYDASYSDDKDSNPEYNHDDEPHENSRTRKITEEEEDYYSEPEPEREVPAKQRREGFFRKKVNDEEDEDNDFFDSDDEPAPVKKPKPPKLDPEDPDYWIEEEESPLSSIIHKPRNGWKWWLAGALTLLGMLIFAWVWFLRPYTDSAVKYGYIRNMERRGSIIKTFEGTMIPYKELGDPDPLYFNDVRFSVASDSLAAVMKRMMLGCVPVRVEYEMYHTALPWKGEEKMIIIKADTADPKKILPPEYRVKE